MKSMSEQKLEEVMQKAAETVQEKDSKPQQFDIDAIIKLGRLEQTIEVVPGFRVTMHSLSDSERAEAMRYIKDDIMEMAFAQKMETMKKPVLTYAITKLNETEFTTKESKDVLFDLIGQMSAPLVDMINLKYTEMYASQLEMVSNGLKKK